MAFINRRRDYQRSIIERKPIMTSKNMPRLFDRTQDVSKLVGWNTRNVPYRWNIFEPYVKDIPPDAYVLDFGCGSLRETFDMAMRDYRVTAVDLNQDMVDAFLQAYDWNLVTHKPEFHIGPLSSLKDKVGSERYRLVLAFDVIEHLDYPEQVLPEIRHLLCDNGLLFVTVPNKYALPERYRVVILKVTRAVGIRLTPGAPHVQFKSPAEWRTLLQYNGFKILEHEMASGLLVVTWFHLLGIPIRFVFHDVIGSIVRNKGHQFNTDKLGQVFYPAWLMKRTDVLEQLSKRWLQSLYFCNLIVAQKV